MDWDIDQARIYFAVNFIGLLDELAVFNRPLTPEEVTLLHQKPGVLSSLKTAGAIEEVDQFLAQIRQKKGAPPAAPKFPFDAATAKKYQKDYADWLGMPVELKNGGGMTFVLVPPGTFVMGSPKDEPGHGSGGYDETQHQVTISRPFYLSKHETTTGQFRKFVEATKYVTDIEKKGGGNAHDAKGVWEHRLGTEWRKPGFAGPFELKDDHPVVHVSHTDCRAFCKWLSQQSGPDRLTYDLPTEAQWEWACRAGSGDRYWWGPDEDKTGKVANVGDKTLKKVHPDWPRKIMDMDDGHAFLSPVGSYRPNGFGLHDMLGNVWEFCATHYGDYPKDAVTDPGDLDPKRGFAVRGGGWSNEAKDVRCASRNADPPHFGHSNLGFRAALLLPVR
jgi:formylglycine-generating enzyme required for sulfatase activity